MSKATDAALDGIDNLELAIEAAEDNGPYAMMDVKDYSIMACTSLESLWPTQADTIRRAVSGDVFINNLGGQPEELTKILKAVMADLKAQIGITQPEVSTPPDTIDYFYTPLYDLTDVEDLPEPPPEEPPKPPQEPSTGRILEI